MTVSSNLDDLLGSTPPMANTWSSRFAAEVYSNAYRIFNEDLEKELTEIWQIAFLQAVVSRMGLPRELRFPDSDLWHERLGPFDDDPPEVFSAKITTAACES